MAIKISGTTVISDSRNIENIGIATATTFSGQVSAGVGTIGNVQISAGIITATAGNTVTYYGDGSQLSGVAAAGGGDFDITSSLFV